MAAAANPLALGIGAGASFAGGVISAIGSGPSKQMQGLNDQVQDFNKFMTAQAKTEGLAASSVFQNLMAPLQRIVSGGPQQAGWSNAQVSAYNADATNRAAAIARDRGGLGAGTSGNPGASDARQLAAQQAAEDARSSEITAGEIKSADVGREEFNTAVGEEKQLPSVFGTANQGAEAAGAEQTRAETSQQNIDTEKKGASFSGVLGKGLSGLGGAVLGGLSPASAGSKLAAQQMVQMSGKSKKQADKDLDDNEDVASAMSTPVETTIDSSYSGATIPTGGSQ
jgi:hypothetical protein